MLACLDVRYDDTHAYAGCLVFRDFPDDRIVGRAQSITPVAAPYRPGAFFERELPPMLDVLRRLPQEPTTILVDGYVWLTGKGAGLGARLYDALGGRAAVIGVAKTEWTRPPLPGEDPARRSLAVTRGTSTRPLFVTAVGVDVERAAAHIVAMHGPHRLPTLLKAVDQLVRRMR